MQPTLAQGDRLFLIPMMYGPRARLFGWTFPGFSEPRRGDVVAVRPGYVASSTVWQRIIDPFVRFFTLQRIRAGDRAGWRSSVQVKRIVGLPGDTIRIERFVAYIRPADSESFRIEQELIESQYQLVITPRPRDWDALDPFGEATGEVVLGENEYFVLSDNRAEGIDSRHWGPVSIEDIHGRIVHRYWPFAGWGGV